MKQIQSLQDYINTNKISRNMVYKRIKQDKIKKISIDNRTFIISDFEIPEKIVKEVVYKTKDKIIEVEVDKIIYKDSINTLNEIEQFKNEIDVINDSIINYIFYTFIISSLIASALTYYFTK